MPSRKHPNIKVPIEQRFWAKVVRRGDDECWGWTGARNPHGYGVLNRGGRGEGNELAHRVSYRIHKGPIPPGKEVCHSCDTRDCPNPGHLFAGSHGQNMADMGDKGRRPWGEDHETHRLTTEQVIEIRRRYDARERVNVRTPKGSPDSPDALAREFDVSEVTVRDIVKRRTWRHV